METLLIADASEDLCVLLRRCLEHKYEVLCCHDGLEALSLLRSRKPRILLLDLRLPRLDGLSLLWEIRHQLPQVILAMSSDHSDYSIQRAVDLGADMVLYKPCSLSATLAHLDKLVQQKFSGRPCGSMPRQVLESFLDSLAFSHCRDGRRYLLCAAPLFMQDPQQRLTKELYPAVGKRFLVSAGAIEHAIRSAIQDAWQRGGRSLWLLHFPESADRCPSNLAVLGKTAQILHQALPQNFR